jgi:hypothetical protein
MPDLTKNAKDLEEEGGPAFPASNDADKQYNRIYYGMSMRDYFAGQALVGIASVYLNTEHETLEPRTAADIAYALADAMISYRK